MPSTTLRTSALRIFLLSAILLCALAAGAQAAPVRLLILGDSLAAGYGLPPPSGFEPQLTVALAARGYEVRIIDGALSGDTSAGGLRRLDGLMAAKPQAAILELGGNDGLRNLDPEAMRRNLTAILDRLQAARVPVLLAGIRAPARFGTDYQRRFHQVFDDLGRRPGVVYEPRLLEGVFGVPALKQADRLHPNAAGVRLEIEHILPYVERLLEQVPTA